MGRLVKDMMRLEAPADPEGRWTGLPALTETNDGLVWELKRNVSFRTRAGRVVVVIAPFTFDWASIPAAAWPIIGPPTGRGRGKNYGVPALLHDWLYRCHSRAGVAVSRVFADKVLLEACLYAGVDRWRAWTMFLFVRAFGWASWRRGFARRDAL